MDELRLPFSYGETPATPTGARPRKHHHKYDQLLPGSTVGDVKLACRCGLAEDPLARRRAKSSVRLGKDIERRIERIYGPEKIGERNLPIDHLGRDWKWQSKATRSPKPLWLAAVQEPTWFPKLPVWITTPLMHAMAFGRPDMGTVVVRTFVTPRVRTEEFMFCTSHDWHDYKMGANVGVPAYGYFAIEGHAWLDIVGRDEP